MAGLFYISTFIDRSDKLFKGQATTSDLLMIGNGISSSVSVHAKPNIKP